MIKKVYYVAKTAVRDVDIRGAPAVGTAPVPELKIKVFVIIGRFTG